MKLTKATLATLALPAGKSDLLVFDDDLPGFGIRVRSGGKRTYVVQYKAAGGKQRRLTLGDARKLDPDAARKVARERLAAAALGGDPQRDKVEARTAHQLGSLIGLYLEARKPELRPSTYYSSELYLKRYWKPLHGLPANELSRRDVASTLAAIAAKHGKTTGLRAQAALSALFTWSMTEGLAEQNPVIGTKKPDRTQPRSRVLTDAELVAIWNATEANDYGRAVKLLMLTGQRRDEVGRMTWSEVNAAAATWSISGTRTKNHRDHIVPLPSLALEIIGEVPHRESCDYLFGKRTSGFRGWGKSKAALDRKLAAVTIDGRAMAPWNQHDLRRTFSTRLADLGVLPHVIEQLINHVSGHKAGVAGIYNRSSYELEAKAAMEIWDRHIRALIGRPAATARKVVSLAGRNRLGRRG